MKCPFNCEKVSNLTTKVSGLISAGKQLSRENLQLQQVTESIRKITEEGHQLLWVGKHNGNYYAIFIHAIYNDTYDSCRIVQLHALPYEHTGKWRAQLNFNYKACCKANLGEVDAEFQGNGYGTLLMEHTLSFLRSAGIRTVTGWISQADFKRREKLWNFYGEMLHFTITPGTTKDWLRLDLYKEPVPVLTKDGAVVCCRSVEYDLLKSEGLLAASDINNDPA